MYHRVGSPPFDPWGLSVSRGRFAEQLEALAERRTVLSMDALVAAVEGGAAPRSATALTFDDGYADNLTVAKPLLEALGMPATVFLTTGAVASGRPFWWDELGDLVFRTSGAADFAVTAGGARLAAEWAAQPRLPDWLPGWRAGHGPRCARTAAYLALWRALQPLAEPARDQAMAALHARLGPPDIPGDETAAVLSPAMARELASGTVTIGGHARSHRPLTSFSPKEARDEIAGGRREVEALTGAAPTGFAYPHGAYDDALAELVAEAGYRWAVTTRQDTVSARHPERYALPRLAVCDWSGPRLLRKIAGRGG